MDVPLPAVRTAPKTSVANRVRRKVVPVCLAETVALGVALIRISRGARHEADGETVGQEKQGGAEALGGEIAKADRAMVLADAERLQDLDHAGRVQAPLHDDPGKHRKGRAVQTGIPQDRAEQSYA